MASAFMRFSGPKWDTLGYDSYDFSQCAHYTQVKNGAYTMTNLRKFRVLANGKKRATVWAVGAHEAKLEACRIRGWNEADVHAVYMLHH